jgi:hypothetical protein
MVQANVQPRLAGTDDEEEAEQPKKKPAKAKKEPWPAALPERMRLVHQALASAGNPLAAKELASHFKGDETDTMDELVATLAAVGQARWMVVDFRVGGRAGVAGLAARG